MNKLEQLTWLLVQFKILVDTVVNVKNITQETPLSHPQHQVLPSEAHLKP